MKVKQEIKIEPVVIIEPHGPSVIAMHTTPESLPVIVIYIFFYVITRSQMSVFSLKIVFYFPN